jgi:hypothetical protein
LNDSINASRSDDFSRAESNASGAHARRGKWKAISQFGNRFDVRRHDLNNLLTSILCNAGLAAESLPPDHDARKLLRDLPDADL